MSEEAVKTGPGPTVVIAIEQQFPAEQRILEDTLAYQILPPGMRAFVWLMQFRWARDWMMRTTEKSMPGIWSAMVCRKRYIDKKAQETAVNMDAVVNLGAGFDTRLYRLPEMAGIPAWELDLQQNIEAKQKQLRKVFGAIPANVQLVPVDFNRETLSEALAAHGYKTDMRTFFIWEAVTQYLTEDAVRATFDFLAQAAAGSRLAFTYVRRDFLAGEAMYNSEAAYKEYVTSGLWRFGLAPDEVHDLLAAYGWRVLEHLGYDELAQRFVTPTGRQLASTPIERMVYAEKQ